MLLSCVVKSALLAQILCIPNTIPTESVDDELPIREMIFMVSDKVNAMKLGQTAKPIVDCIRDCSTIIIEIVLSTLEPDAHH